VTYTEYLKSINACGEAISAAEGKTAQQAWDTCERGDWMLWLAGKLSGEPGCDRRRRLVLASTECARLAWPYVKEQDKQVVQACYETAEQWARGENGITLEVVEAAAWAASAASAAAVDAAWAAVAAAWAAWAASAAAVDAASAAWAASAAAVDAARTAAGAAAMVATLKQCAVIVRKYYPISPAMPLRLRAF